MIGGREVFVNLDKLAGELGARAVPLLYGYVGMLAGWFYLVGAAALFGFVILPFFGSIAEDMSANGGDAGFFLLGFVVLGYLGLVVAGLAFALRLVLGQPLGALSVELLQSRYFADDEIVIPDPRYSHHDEELVRIKPNIAQLTLLALAVMVLLLVLSGPIMFVMNGDTAIASAFAFLGIVLLAADPSVLGPGATMGFVTAGIPLAFLPALGVRYFSGGTQIYDFHICGIAPVDRKAIG